MSAQRFRVSNLQMCQGKQSQVAFVQPFRRPSERLEDSQSFRTGAAIPQSIDERPRCLSIVICPTFMPVNTGLTLLKQHGSFLLERKVISFSEDRLYRVPSSLHCHAR
jgi:hypothetical protein